jgi:hypothetical protein
MGQPLHNQRVETPVTKSLQSLLAPENENENENKRELFCSGGAQMVLKGNEHNHSADGCINAGCCASRTA